MSFDKDKPLAAKEGDVEWTVWVEGRPMRVFTPKELSQEDVLEQAKIRFHPMPHLYEKGDKHPLDITVKPADSDWTPWVFD